MKATFTQSCGTKRDTRQAKEIRPSLSRLFTCLDLIADDLFSDISHIFVNVCVYIYSFFDHGERQLGQRAENDLLSKEKHLDEEDRSQINSLKMDDIER